MSLACRRDGGMRPAGRIWSIVLQAHRDQCSACRQNVVVHGTLTPSDISQFQLRLSSTLSSGL